MIELNRIVIMTDRAEAVARAVREARAVGRGRHAPEDWRAVPEIPAARAEQRDLSEGPGIQPLAAQPDVRGVLPPAGEAGAGTTPLATDRGEGRP